MTITLTREEAQQVLDALECMNEGAFNAEIKLLRARLSAPEPEPVAGYRWEEGRTPPSVTFTAPPQREWQGLTDEEMSAAMDYWSDPVRSAYGGAHSADGEYVGMIDTWQYIEAKLKEKNAPHL